ncbi:MAG TPA: hypothetical protein VMW12_13900 [Candidatus Dormibacteraeota bacterium]|nr:hypothetical protein [Candidatus Dormibacteraeota bacterium]
MKHTLETLTARSLMNAKYRLIAIGAMAFGLAACGGGGASGGSGPNIPNVPVTPAVPTPTPAPSGPPHPAAGGDTFTFNGTLARSDAYTYPVASPLPPTAASATIKQNVTVITTPNPFGAGQVQDFQTLESDVYPAQTLSSKNDFYYQSGSAFQLLGYSSVDDVGDATTVQYATPQVVDQLPETTGASWTNSPAASMTQTFIDGETASRTTAADGTYTDTEQIYGTGTDYPSVKAILSENADGSGEVQIVRYENGRTGFQANETIYDNYFISPPSAQSSNAQFLYVTYQLADLFYGAPSPPPAAPFASMPIWYKTPLALYSESDNDLGPQTIPAACNAPAAFGTQGREIQQQLKSTDTVLGTVTSTTTTAYVVDGFGPVCVQLASTVNTYFDYSMDTTITPVFYQGSGALQTTTIAQTLTLASQGAYPQSAAGRKSAGGQSPTLHPVSTAEIAIARLRMVAAIETDRAKRIRALAKNLLNRSAAKGVR